MGTYAGQVVMQGFIDRRVGLFLRRAFTMAPALVVLGLGLDPTRTLVISQVVLSFGIPFALVPTIMLTRRPAVMGALANRSVTTAVASVVAALIIALNAFLLYETFLGCRGNRLRLCADERDNALNDVVPRRKIDSSLSGRCVLEDAVLRCDDAETDDWVDLAAARRASAFWNSRQERIATMVGPRKP